MSWNFDPTTTSPAPRTILIYEFVTGGGMAGEPLPESWAREGSAMRRALAREFARAATPTRVVATIDPRLPRDDGPWASVEVDSIDRLEALAEQADFTLLIAPETSGVLESLTRRLDRRGSRLLGAGPEAVALAADKATFADWLGPRGMPTPRSRVLPPGQSPPEAWPYPSVVKPIDGAGCLETYRVDGPGEAETFDEVRNPRLIQEFLPGVAMSATFLIRDRRARLLAVGEQRVTVEAGRFGYEGGVLPRACPGAVPLLRRVVESIPGLRGLVGVDFIRDGEGHASILEVNPRPTTSCVGILRVLPPGLVAEAWLAPKIEDWDRMMDRVEGLIEEAPPVGFDATGRTWTIGESVGANRL